MTIISSEQSALERFSQWIQNHVPGTPFNKNSTELMTSFIKILPANSTSIPSATFMNNDALCPVFVGDKVSITLTKPFFISGHLHGKIHSIERTTLSKHLLENQSNSRSSSPMDSKPQEALLSEPAACEKLLTQSVTGFIYREHLDPKDAVKFFRNNISTIYHEGHGAKLARAIGAVRPNCGVDLCLNCVYQAFEKAFPSAWPTHEDYRTINAGSCARSFADFWQQQYESRMKIKRVWWGRGHPKNLIMDPYEIPLGSVVVWDRCVSVGSCPGGTGFGDIGIISAIKTDKFGKTKSYIESFYAPRPVADQDAVCKGDITGVWIPWAG